MVLLRGPASVGKRTLARHVLSKHGAIKADIREVEQLSAEAARDLRGFVATAPFSKIKGCIVRLDGASEQGLNVLLKTLEEPPSASRFIITAQLYML